MIRINKHLASLGIASRRAIDTMIENKQIQVNDQLATPGIKIDPEKDIIKINGKIISYTPPQLEYYILNKPCAYLSSTRSFKHRPTVLDLVKSKTRLYPVGRLDQDSQGLILLTNDGDLTARLTHPKHHISKTYLVTILGGIKNQDLKQLQNGINLEDGRTQPCQTKIIKDNYPKDTILEITLFEGRKRQIRRMCAHLHLFIKKLERISIGPLKLGNLGLGKSRPLTPSEIQSLKKL